MCSLTETLVGGEGVEGDVGEIVSKAIGILMAGSLGTSCTAAMKSRSRINQSPTVHGPLQLRNTQRPKSAVVDIKLQSIQFSSDNLKTAKM
jgi:hypothetical protein